MRHTSYCHRGGQSELTAETIDQRFRAIVADHGPRDCVVARHQDQRLSYAEVDARVEALARGLLALELQRGDRVGVWATNHVEWVLLQLATARVGAILVNVNPAYRAAELRHALRQAEVQVLFTMPSFKSSAYVEMLTALLPESLAQRPRELSCAAAPALRSLVVFDPMGEATRPGSGWLLWDEVLGLGHEVDPAAVAARSATLDCDDPINIQFTSGTTGSPKGVLLTHHNILNNAISCAEALSFGPEDRLCVSVPFYHCFGMVVSNLACFATGAALVVPDQYFTPAACLDAVEAEACTALHGVPTMFVAMLELNTQQARDLSSLRAGIMAGAPCPPELVRAVVDDVGCRELLIGYGQTEASPVTHITRADDSFERRVSTVGTNMPHMEAKIVDPASGATLPLGEPGEVCFRGYHVMRGYYGQPEATRETIDEGGWLHSGDLGTMDVDGYVRITGRLKDMIIRGGENIYPAEIEAFLYEHPAVEEAAVFGVPDPRMGEEVGVWVKLHAGKELDADALRALVKSNMAHFKVPRHVWFVDSFPMTVTGKIRKIEIRETVQGWLAEA